MNENITKKIIVAISGSSGAIYGIRLLEILKQLNIETHLIISKAAKITILQETDYKIEEVINLASFNYPCMDISSQISCGSFKTSGMIIAPCSMNTLGLIANSIESNLISRAAGVILKERRKLVLMPRETPLHQGHLENFLKVTQYGGIIAPPVPAFYNKPQTIQELIDHSLSRVLDLFDIDTGLIKRWKGLHPKPLHLEQIN